MAENITFTSNIKVVSPVFFRDRIAALQTTAPCVNICTWDILPRTTTQGRSGNLILKSAFSRNMPQGYTQGVRSCTSMLVADKGKKAPLFAHIRNSQENKVRLPLLGNFIHGTNAILVGSKDMFPHSKEVFNTLKEHVQKKQIPITSLQGLRAVWEAHLAYISDIDTLYLCINKIQTKKGTPEYIHSMRGLSNVFRSVEISPTDKIEFLNPMKEMFVRLILQRRNRSIS